MASESRTRRKRHSAELEALILAERAAPGALVAMSRGIDANVVHRCRQVDREGGSTLVKVRMATGLADAGDEFVPVVVIISGGCGRSSRGRSSGPAPCQFA